MFLNSEEKFYGTNLDHVSKGKKLIGICVGMQMLFDSEENGLTNGMSLLGKLLY